jgi:hypothetical protein
MLYFVEFYYQMWCQYINRVNPNWSSPVPVRGGGFERWNLGYVFEA